SGPPVMPASPVVLGPSDQTIFPGAVNAQQVQRAVAQHAPPGRDLPLPAPPPAMMGKPGATASASAKTAFIQQPAGHAAPAGGGGPSAAAALKTAFMEAAPPAPQPQPQAPGGAKTAFMDPSSAAALRPPEAPEIRRTSTAVPQMAAPAQAVNMT